MGILGDLIKLLEAAENRNEKLRKFKNYIKYLKSKNFYDEGLIKAFLFERDITLLPKTKFIDYKKYLDYYEGEILTNEYSYEEVTKTLRLPYKEIINFIKHPNTNIFVDNHIGEFKIKKSIEKLTEENLKAFISEKPNTVDGPLLRMSNLAKQKGQQNYKCSLEYSSYYMQVRTNLTLDYPLDIDGTQSTLRIMDLNKYRKLSNFNSSLFVNSIGVSSVIFYRKNGLNFYFMKLRHKKDGVFETMFGSVSGVVQYFHGEKIVELVSYATNEIKREFHQELGLPNDSSIIKRITPLSFTRELMRGGKPQFFFLIEINEPTQKDFKKLFRTSEEGLDEFYDDWVSEKTNYKTALSPEFVTNLSYTLQYFQAIDKNKLNPIVLN